MAYIFATIISLIVGYASSDWLGFGMELSFVFSTIAFGGASYYFKKATKDWV